MKKFEFRLQKLLDLREVREQELKNELSAIVSKQNLERVKQQELNQKITDYGGAVREKMIKGTITAEEMMMYEKFVHLSRQAITFAERRIGEMEPAVNEVRQRLVIASTEKKVVEKLREKKLAEYNYEVNREITKENDDMNQKIYMRRLRETEGVHRW